jgi:hypothetical protein
MKMERGESISRRHIRLSEVKRRGDRRALREHAVPPGVSLATKGIAVKKPVTEQISEKVIPPARGKKTPQADFDRNRDGLYGGLPKARDRAAPGPLPDEPHPPSNTQGRARQQPDRRRK